METIINLILIKIVDVEKLKSGDIILTFNPDLLIWVKCKIIRIEKYRIILKFIKGSMKEIPWYEHISKIRNPDYYRQA